MMLELFLVKKFKEYDVKLYKTVPSKVEMPYVVYDRISGDPDSIPNHEFASMAFNVYGKDLEQIDDQYSKIKNIIRDLQQNQSYFAIAEIENVVDTTFDDSAVVYTIYANFLHQEDIS